MAAIIMNFGIAIMVSIHRVNCLSVISKPSAVGPRSVPTAATSTNTTQVATTAMVQAAIDADVTVHAALRSASGTYGHAQIYTSGGDLYIVTT